MGQVALSSIYIPYNLGRSEELVVRREQVTLSPSLLPQYILEIKLGRSERSKLK